MRIVVLMLGLASGALLGVGPFLAPIGPTTRAFMVPLGLLFAAAGLAAWARPGLSALLLVVAGLVAILAYVAFVPLHEWAVIAFVLAGLSAFASRRQRLAREKQEALRRQAARDAELLGEVAGLARAIRNQNASLPPPGVRPLRVCPSCGIRNHPGSRYCQECGLLFSDHDRATRVGEV